MCVSASLSRRVFSVSCVFSHPGWLGLLLVSGSASEVQVLGFGGRFAGTVSLLRRVGSGGVGLLALALGRLARE